MHLDDKSDNLSIVQGTISRTKNYSTTSYVIGKIATSANSQTIIVLKKVPIYLKILLSRAQTMAW